MKLNCLILDDEPLALKLMEEYASKVPFLSVKKASSNPTEVLKFLETDPVDLIFLDINMPDINGIDLLKGINNNTMAVFCTAYPDFAIQGFELQVIDYLLKPFSFDRFLKAAFKAQEQHLLKINFNTKTEASQETEFIFVKADYSLVKINTADIIYIEGLKDYIKIHLNGNPKPVLTLQSLRSLEEKLPSSYFSRIHKSFIVNIKYINSVQKNSAIIGTREIPIGNQYKDGFTAIIEKNTPK